MRTQPGEGVWEDLHQNLRVHITEWDKERFQKTVPAYCRCGMPFDHSSNVLQTSLTYLQLCRIREMNEHSKRQISEEHR